MKCKNPECRETIATLQKQVKSLMQEVQDLTKEVKELKVELEKYRNPPKNSENSSIPPSQDPWRKYLPKAKSSRKTGGQPGHKGHFHALSDTPDIVEPLYPETCLHCGNTDLKPLDAYREVRQQIDLPQIHPEVTEYRQHLGLCTQCGKTSRGTFPKTLNATVQIGPHTTQLLGYLKVCHHLSQARLQQIFKDVFSFPLSQGVIDSKLKQLSRVKQPQYKSIALALKNQPVLGSDETGNRINGKNGYVWVFQSPELCCFLSSPKRNFKVIEKVIGKTFNGVWVSDRFGAQLKIEANHQLCLAHVMRDLAYLIEAENSAWAKRVKSLLKAAMDFRRHCASLYNPLNSQQFRTVQYFQQRLEKLFQKPPPKKRERRLFKSLQGRQQQLLTFLRNPEAPFDNNASERALRNRVIQRKVSGGFRTLLGAHCHDILLSIVETAKRQNLSILSALSPESQLLLTT